MEIAKLNGKVRLVEWMRRVKAKANTSTNKNQEKELEP
jgi:hypothetical protein